MSRLVSCRVSENPTSICIPGHLSSEPDCKEYIPASASLAFGVGDMRWRTVISQIGGWYYVHLYGVPIPHQVCRPLAREQELRESIAPRESQLFCHEGATASQKSMPRQSIAMVSWDRNCSLRIFWMRGNVLGESCIPLDHYNSEKREKVLRMSLHNLEDPVRIIRFLASNGLSNHKGRNTFVSDESCRPPSLQWRIATWVARPIL